MLKIFNQLSRINFNKDSTLSGFHNIEASIESAVDGMLREWVENNFTKRQTEELPEYVLPKSTSKDYNMFISSMARRIVKESDDMKDLEDVSDHIPRVVLQELVRRMVNRGVDNKVNLFDRKRYLHDGDLSDIKSRLNLDGMIAQVLEMANNDIAKIDLKIIKEAVDDGIALEMQKQILMRETELEVQKHIKEMDLKGAWSKISEGEQKSIIWVALSAEVIKILDFTSVAAIEERRENLSSYIRKEVNVAQQIKHAEGLFVEGEIFKMVSASIDNERKKQGHTATDNKLLSEFKTAVYAKVMKEIADVAGKDGVAAYYAAVGDKDVRNYVKEVVEEIGLNDQNVFIDLNKNLVRDSKLAKSANLENNNLVKFSNLNFRVGLQKIIHSLGISSLAKLTRKLANVFAKEEKLDTTVVLSGIEKLSKVFKVAVGTLESPEFAQFAVRYNNDAKFRSNVDILLDTFKSSHIHNRREFLGIINKLADSISEAKDVANLSGMKETFEKYGFIRDGFFTVFGFYQNAKSKNLDKCLTAMEVAIVNPMLFDAFIKAAESSAGNPKGIAALKMVNEIFDKIKEKGDVKSHSVLTQDQLDKLVAGSFVNLSKGKGIEEFVKNAKLELRVESKKDAHVASAFAPPPSTGPVISGVKLQPLPPAPLVKGAAVPPALPPLPPEAINRKSAPPVPPLPKAQEDAEIVKAGAVPPPPPAPKPPKEAKPFVAKPPKQPQPKALGIQEQIAQGVKGDPQGKLRRAEDRQLAPPPETNLNTRDKMLQAMRDNPQARLQPPKDRPDTSKKEKETDAADAVQQGLSNAADNFALKALANIRRAHSDENERT